MRLLLVEDDPSISQPLVRALSREGFDVRHVAGGRAALEAVRDGGVDLVLLDLNLGDLDGLDVCRRIRSSDAELPIVMLTARAEEVDLVVGFDAGADDYVTKPFSMAELTARVRARLRTAAGTQLLEVAPVRIDVGAHRAWLRDEELMLTPKEFDLLVLLVSEAGNVVPRRRLYDQVWAEPYVANSRTLDVHISTLRRKLGDEPDDPTLIVTIRGVGFRFDPLDA